MDDFDFGIFGSGSPREFDDIFRKSVVESSEYRIAKAVLVEGVENLRLSPSSSMKRFLIADAKEWIENESENYVFSFERVCSILRLEPSVMRKKLLAEH